jgi:CDGSH-type Zn-finger protein
VGIIIADHVTKDMTPEQAYNLGRGLAQKEHTYKQFPRDSHPEDKMIRVSCRCGAFCDGTREETSAAQEKHVEHEAEISGKAFRAFVNNNSEENRDRA